jgi:hypothetical protein
VAINLEKIIKLPPLRGRRLAWLTMERMVNSMMNMHSTPPLHINNLMLSQLATYPKWMVDMYTSMPGKGNSFLQNFSTSLRLTARSRRVRTGKIGLSTCGRRGEYKWR